MINYIERLFNNLEMIGEKIDEFHELDNNEQVKYIEDFEFNFLLKALIRLFKKIPNSRVYVNNKRD